MRSPETIVGAPVALALEPVHARRLSDAACRMTSGSLGLRVPLDSANLSHEICAGAAFSSSTSVGGTALHNAAVSTTPGNWTFTDQDGTVFTFRSMRPSSERGSPTTRSSVPTRPAGRAPWTS